MPSSFLSFLIVILSIGMAWAYGPIAVTIAQEPTAQTLLTKFCIDCHRGTEPAGNIDLTPLSALNWPEPNSRLDSSNWERVLRRLQSRQMPPPESIRPDEGEYIRSIEQIVRHLDTIADRFPRPGSPPGVRRMTRLEYENAIRDLFDIAIDGEEWLPPDESSHGFDNVTVTELSPVLLHRYLKAAKEISRIVVGGKQRSPGGVTKRFPADLSQDTHIDGLPLGTRGGGWIEHTFARDGQYEVQVRLAKDRDEHIEGLKESHEMDFLLDRHLMHRLTIEAPKGGDHSRVDADLKARFSISAGTHQVAVTFPKKSGSLLEIRRQPFDASFNRHRHPRREPAIYEITIVGPLDHSSPGDTNSRRILFDGIKGIERRELAVEDEAMALAKAVLERILVRAYRRSIEPDDLDAPMKLFLQNYRSNGFEAGVESALAAILVNPNFLFRIERVPENFAPGSHFFIAESELASRLSYFLWSSIPDQPLLEKAMDHSLNNEQELMRQSARLLQDPKSQSLVENFADQWLYLRNLESIHPDLRLFPDFDDNLRTAFRQETEMFFEYVMREDRSVLELLQCNYTFLNDRLARHYRIPNILGSQFRRVELEPTHHRGGLLRHGSILTITSYATRTSPTIRGSWIMKNILGTPPPAPPPNVPALKDKETLANLSLRERLAQHRSNPACASCHNMMDPIGFALENYDAVGRWREFEDDRELDASGGLPDGSTVHGVPQLESQLLVHRDLFVQAMVEKLMIFALGRGMEWSDGPEIRKIVARAKQNNYRFSSLIEGIVLSKPFRMRTVP